jgi:hypothetical protein
MNYGMYSLSLILIGGPFCYILYKREFTKYFVYVIASTSFLILNLIGSLSAHITHYYNNIGFYFINLLTSLLFFFSFLTIYKLAGKQYQSPKQRFQVNNTSSLLNTSRNFLLGGLLVSLIGMATFSLYISPPFFLITHTLAQMPSKQTLLQHAQATYIATDLKQAAHPQSLPVVALVNKIQKSDSSTAQSSQYYSITDPVKVNTPETNNNASIHFLITRISIVVSRPFHWFALLLFELPAFLSVLSVLAFCIACTQKNSARLKSTWFFFMLTIVSISFIASFWILSKQYSAYLLAAIFLVWAVYKNQISLKTIALLSVFILLLFSILFYFYLGLPLSIFLAKIGLILYHRLMEVYPWASAVTYALFPGTYLFLKGQSMPNVLHLANYHFVSLANLIYPYIYFETGGSAPVPAIFESYANWGWWGVIASELIIFFTIFGVTLLSWSKNIFLFALAVYISIKLILFWQSPFWFGAFEPTLVLFFLVLFAFSKAFPSNPKKLEI